VRRRRRQGEARRGRRRGRQLRRTGGSFGGAGGSAGGGLAGCLDTPGALDRPPSGQLPCELIPPGLRL
jgi:hypothetical protein